MSSAFWIRTSCALLLIASCSEYKVSDGPNGPRGTDTTSNKGDDDDNDTTTDSGWQWTPEGDDDDDDDTTNQGDDDDDTVPGDDDDDDDDDTTPGLPDTGTWDTGNWDLCNWAEHVAGYLDAYNTPNDDKVVYCHKSGGPNYVMQDTSVSACLTHIDHLGDIFPTTICDS